MTALPMSEVPRLAAVIAAADLCHRAGGVMFEVGYLHENVPVEEAGWYCTAQFRGAKVIGEGAGPEIAADELVHKVLHGGRCTHCGHKVNTRPAEGHWAGGECLWWRLGDRWERSCSMARTAATPDEPTSERLARALEEAGLDELVERARAAEFDDYRSSHATPELILVAELHRIGTPAAMVFAQRVIDGEFDATKAESDAWAASPEGRKVLDQLIDLPRHPNRAERRRRR